MIALKSAVEILKSNKCGDLFERNIDSIKAEYRALAKLYHPDINKSSEAQEVFAKVNLLYDRALELIAKGDWEVSNLITIKSKSCMINNYKYLSEKVFELGKFYICRERLVYVLDSKNKKYYDNAIYMVKNLHYADTNMEKEFSRYFPIIEDTFETVEGNWCIVLQKSEDVFLLEDLLNQQGGKLAEKHTAWVISRLCNICCYLNYQGIVHNGISLSNCFVSPKYHTILLLGGWWYAVEQGEKMIGTQKAIFDIMPLKDKNEKISSYRTDLESVKLIGKQLLNNLSLLTKKGEIESIPDSMKEWLRKGASDKAVEEFTSWNVALDRAWGERKFIVLNVTESDIYK